MPNPNANIPVTSTVNTIRESTSLSNLIPCSLFVIFLASFLYLVIYEFSLRTEKLANSAPSRGPSGC